MEVAENKDTKIEEEVEEVEEEEVVEVEEEVMEDKEGRQYITTVTNPATRSMHAPT